MSTTHPEGVAATLGHGGPQTTKRDFLKLVAAAGAAVGVGAIVWPMIDSMNPAGDVLALSSVEVDITSITEGMGITAVWRGKPIFVRHRTPEEIKTVEAVPLNQLIEPATDQSRIKEGVRETGCGAGRTLNALTVFEADGSVHTQALLPGTTIADPQLQQDSVPYAAGAMGQMPAGCAQGSVVNTRFLGLDGQAPGAHPTPGSQPAAWSEVWTLQACAKRADVTVHFKPDQTGTEIRADPLK